VLKHRPYWESTWFDPWLEGGSNRTGYINATLSSVYFWFRTSATVYVGSFPTLLRSCPQ
jgi:hypothetical protein